MAVVSPTFIARWRSRKHVGDAKPVMWAQIRRGRFERKFGAHTMLDGSHPHVGYFTKTPRNKPWHAYWISDTDWVTLPNVLEFTPEQDFDGNGISRFTLQVENIIYTQQSGFSGIYHAIERGYLAPWRSVKPPRRPGLGVAANDWYDVLATNAQIRIWAGYGDEVVPLLTGLLDDVDLESKPDRITLVGRDFGQMFTDQRFMGWVKDRTVKDPVTFADRRYADETKKVGGGARASSSRLGNPPRFVADDSADSMWVSEAHDGPNVTEWVHVHVPRGRYEDVQIHPGFHGMECYLSIYARPGPSGYWSIDGERHSHEGWVDVGAGDVPGGHGGHPYVRKINNLAARGRSYRLNHILHLGANSTIRASFRGLKKGRHGNYYASCRTLKGVKRERKRDAIKQRWILVDDAADIVKIILRWCGFQEWEVEDTGVHLADKLVFNRSDFLIDAIKKISELTNYIFFVGDPSLDEDSRGVPTFRMGSAFFDSPGELAIRDTDLLTGIKAHITDSPLVTVIRVRGKLAKASQGGTRDFVGSGADTLRCYNKFYRPPWAREGGIGESSLGHSGGGRTGGVIKHIVHIDPMLSSDDDVEKAARFIAAAECMKSATAIVEIPAMPGFELDDQVYLLDSGTGMATRLWIAQRQSTFHAGEQTSWTMSLGGVLLDTPDFQAVRAELEELYEQSEEEQPVPLGGHRQTPLVTH